VNVSGDEAATANGTPPSIAGVPADQGYVRATVPVSTPAQANLEALDLAARLAALAPDQPTSPPADALEALRRHFTRWLARLAERSRLLPTNR
jgi:hypothetical protein